MNKYFGALLGAYGIWGLVLPLYLKLFSDANSLYVLCSRAVWSLALCAVLVAVTKKWKDIVALFADKRRFWPTCLAGVVILLNWYLYIWAISNDHMLDASLGYYINPLMVVVVGWTAFREKATKLQIAAVCIASVGVLAVAIGIGKFPWVALMLAISFTVYGTIKKTLHVETITSLTVETACVFPFMLGIMLYMDFNGLGVLSNQGASALPFLMLLGVLTALPLLLYSFSMVGLPYSFVGVMQFITPTALAIIGVFSGEPFTAAHLLAFGLIWVGVAIYIYSSFKEERNGRKKLQGAGD